MLTLERKATRNARCGGCADVRTVLITLATVSGRTPDGDGGWTDSYTALSPATAWAAVDAATPRDIERFVGNTVTAAISHIVSLRYHKGVTTNTRITFVDPAGTHTLYVRGLRNVEQRNVELQLACEESVAPLVVRLP